MLVGIGWVMIGGGALAAGSAAGQLPLEKLAACEVVWDTPSENAHGSMPIGNGDIGVNAWVEPGGDLLFYVSKTDAWDENGRLCKIGRVRVKCDPPLQAKEHFRQQLKLHEGVIVIESTIQQKPATLRLWVDANSPVVRVEAESEVPVRCRAELEPWRLRERPFGPLDDGHSGGGLSAHPWKPVLSPDVVVPSGDPRIVWYTGTHARWSMCACKSNTSKR